MNKLLIVQRLTIVVLMSVCMCSCMLKDKQENIIFVDIKEQNASAEDFFDNYQSIVLELNDECIVSGIDKIVFQDNLYVQDGQIIFVFNRKGNYLFKINKRGRGSEEYIDLRDFSVFDSTVYVLSRVEKCIYMYSDQGNYAGSYQLNDWYESIYVQNDSCLFLYSGYSNNQKYNIVLFNPLKDEYPKFFAPFGENQSYSTRHNVFHPTQEGLLVSLPFDYTIYRLTTEALTPLFSVNFNTDFVLPKNKSMNDIAEESKNKPVVRHIDMVDADETAFYLAFTLFQQEMGYKAHLVKINRETQEAQSCLLENCAKASFPFIASPIEFCNKTLLSSFSAASVLKLEKYYGLNYFSQKNLNKENNPVVFVHSLK
ncbi:MAG: 6-bladed beta-propeller [Bacteroidales bacterium]